MKALTAAALTALTLTATALATTAPRWFTPAATQNLLTGSAALYGVRTLASVGTVSGVAFRHASTAHCHGLAARVEGTYSLFSCALAWPSPNDPATMVRATMFVRPWSTRAVCVTQVSAGACPPPAPAKPARGDPRVCGPDQAGCVLNAANTAMQTALTKAGVVDSLGHPLVQRNMCTASASWTHYICAWRGGAGSVVFAVTAAGWSVTATVTG